MGNKQGKDDNGDQPQHNVAKTVGSAKSTLSDRLQHNVDTVTSLNSSTMPTPEIDCQPLPASPPPPPPPSSLSVPLLPPPPPPPPPLPLPLPLQSVHRPRGVADMEIKAHCEKIKRILGTSRSSQMDLVSIEKVITSDDESIMYECFGSIVAIAQNCAPLEGNVLDDYLITCHAMRMNQPNVASKFTLLMTQARELIEELIVPADGMGTKASFVLQRSTSTMLLPPSRRLGNNSSKDVLENAVTPKLTKLSSSQKLVDSAENSLNCSQHSTDYGFLDLSVHFASPGVSQHGGMSRHINIVTAMQQQYDVARAELTSLDIQTGTPSSVTPTTTVGPPSFLVTTVMVPNTLGQGTSK